MSVARLRAPLLPVQGGILSLDFQTTANIQLTATACNSHSCVRRWLVQEKSAALLMRIGGMFLASLGAWLLLLLGRDEGNADGLGRIASASIM
jgi:hypothetical protein